MSKYNEKMALLEDLRARVIFYSCIAEPKNIFEISKLWDYKTSTYFYQSKSKELIEEMISTKLISTLEGSRYQSNYELILEKKRVVEFFEITNRMRGNEIIIEKYDYEVTEGQLEDLLFREFCIEKKPELKEIVAGTEIVGQEIVNFFSLWKTSLFKTIFLSSDLIKKLTGDRWELPKNPLNLLFDITMNMCERIYYFNEGGRPGYTDPFLLLHLEIDEVFPLILTQLESAKSKFPEKSKVLNKRFKEVYDIMKNKFAIYLGRSEISSYHVAKIAEIMGLRR